MTHSPLFHQLDNECVILRSKGVFEQAEVYTRKGELYAKKDAGYMRLVEGGKTSVPNVMWEDLTVINHTVGEFGRLRYAK